VGAIVTESSPGFSTESALFRDENLNLMIKRSRCLDSIQGKQVPHRNFDSINFRNPLGLRFRVLISGKRAAYAALFHEILRLLAIPFDSVLEGREVRTLKKAIPLNALLVLVVGASRSGTTLVYQTLARYMDVSYVTNMTSMFPKSPVTASRLLNWMPKRDSADFHNFYGQTARLDGPNDGFS
jgi:hypothetical protein